MLVNAPQGKQEEVEEAKRQLDAVAAALQESEARAAAARESHKQVIVVSFECLSQLIHQCRLLQPRRRRKNEKKPHCNEKLKQRQQKQKLSSRKKTLRYASPSSVSSWSLFVKRIINKCQRPVRQKQQPPRPQRGSERQKPRLQRQR